MEQKEGVNRDDGRWYTDYSGTLNAGYVTGMLYLGQVEIDTLTEGLPEMPKLTENGYIDAVLDIIRYTRTALQNNIQLQKKYLLHMTGQ